MERLELPGPSPRQGYKDSSSGFRTASIGPCQDVSVSGYKDMAEFSLFHSSCNEKFGGNLKSIEMPIIEGISDKTSLGSPNNRSTGLQLSDYTSILATGGSLPSPDNSISLVARCADDWLAPGNVVWAKNASHEWWPAEVIDESGVPEFSNNQKTGHIFVQLYGSHECTWLDPVGDLSHFDQCYIERSKNPSKAFQDALKQALYKNAQTSTSRVLNGRSNDPKNSNQHEKPVETSSTPSSTRTNCDCDDERRHGKKIKTENRSSVSDMKVDLPETADDCNEGKGKRKRERKVKAKAQSDELNILKKRRARQLRVMRKLGLTAPVGSPFARKRTIS